MELSGRESRHLDYEGSVKRVWSNESKPDRLWFEFTDDYSIFDWGKMPDTIANKGVSLALLGAFIFDRLSRPEFWQIFPNSKLIRTLDPYWLQERLEHPVFAGPEGLAAKGCRTHFKRLVQKDHSVHDLRKALDSGETILMEVLKAEVKRPVPHRIGNSLLYFYPPAIDAPGILQPPGTDGRRLIPLEIVFRFGMPSGSSLPARLAKDPAYSRTLGLKHEPEIGAFFEHPVLEFYTKLEPKDRLLSLQEAALLSGLNAAQFENLVELSLDIALALYFIFADRSIELWDGKIELVADPQGNLILADSVGPDELRLLYDGCHLSKEMIRQIYRGSAWEQAIKEAQNRASQSGQRDRGWKEIMLEDLGQKPEHLNPGMKAIVDKLYGAVTNHILNNEVIRDQPQLKEFVHSVPAYLLSMPSSGVRFT